MRGEIKRRVIRRIANEKRVPLHVASYIYDCKSITAKERLCERARKDMAWIKSVTEPARTPIPEKPEGEHEG